MALIIVVLLAMYLLGTKQGYTGEQLKKILDRSLRPTGQILLVITGGGIIHWVLQNCGMGNLIGSALKRSGLPLIVVAFLIAALIRASVGAAVMAMTMAAGIMVSMPAMPSILQVAKRLENALSFTDESVKQSVASPPRRRLFIAEGADGIYTEGRPGPCRGWLHVEDHCAANPVRLRRRGTGGRAEGWRCLAKEHSDMYNKTNMPAEVGRALNEGGAPMMGLAIALSALLGGFVQSVTRFGAAIVIMLVLPRFLGMLQAPALSASITAALTCGLAWKFRREIDLRTAAVPILTYLASSTVTIRLVGGLDLEVLVLAFGVFLILLSVYFIWFAWNVAIRANFVTASVCGLISGVCTGLFGVGGPLMAIYFLAATDRKETYLASLQFLFAVHNLANLAVRAVCGIYTLDLIPLSIVGILGGHSGPDGGHKGAGPHQY